MTEEKLKQMYNQLETWCDGGEDINIPELLVDIKYLKRDYHLPPDAALRICKRINAIENDVIWAQYMMLVDAININEAPGEEKIMRERIDKVGDFLDSYSIYVSPMIRSENVLHWIELSHEENDKK